MLGQWAEVEIVDGRREELIDLVAYFTALSTPYVGEEEREGNCDPLKWSHPLNRRQETHSVVWISSRVRNSPRKLSPRDKRTKEKERKLYFVGEIVAVSWISMNDCRMTRVSMLDRA